MAVKNSTLTQERLKQLLSYDKESGLFTWLVNRPNGIKKYDIAGHKDTSGYIVFKVDGMLYLAHRLAWFYMFGVWPLCNLDHINGIRDDNKFSNLRRADRYINQQNIRKSRIDNKLGLLGVTAKRRKFQAQISAEGVHIYLGLYSTPQEAHAVYLEAKRKYHIGGTI